MWKIQTFLEASDLKRYENQQHWLALPGPRSWLTQPSAPPQKHHSSQVAKHTTHNTHLFLTCSVELKLLWDANKACCVLLGCSSKKTYKGVKEAVKHQVNHPRLQSTIFLDNPFSVLWQKIKPQVLFPPTHIVIQLLRHYPYLILETYGQSFDRLLLYKEEIFIQGVTL